MDRPPDNKRDVSTETSNTNMDSSSSSTGSVESLIESVSNKSSSIETTTSKESIKEEDETKSKEGSKENLKEPKIEERSKEKFEEPKLDEPKLEETNVDSKKSNTEPKLEEPHSKESKLKKNEAASMESSKEKLEESNLEDSELKEPISSEPIKPKRIATFAVSRSQEDADEPKPLVGYSKSWHVEMDGYDSDDEASDKPKESKSMYSNLKKGNVFVYMVIPPDGGYGWFITLISFLCQIVIDGIVLTVGIILPAIAKEFDETGSKVVLLGSVQLGCYFLAGTVASALINKYGFRPVALSGCLISITVLSIATFSTNLPMMIFFYSILGSPGLSLIWVPSQLIIGYYFEKYRPVAYGISCSGAGMGIVIFAYMNSTLLPEMGWRNLMRLHVGFLIFVFIMGLSYIEVTPTRIGQVKDLDEEESDSASMESLLTDMTRFSRYIMQSVDQDKDFEPILKKIVEPSYKAERKPGCCSRYCKLCCSPCYNCLKRRKEKKTQEMATKRYLVKRDLIDRHDFYYMGPMIQIEPSEAERLLRASLPDQDGVWRTISIDGIDERYRNRSRSIVNTLSTMYLNRAEQKQRYQTYEELKETVPNPLLKFLSPKNLIHPKIHKVFSLLFDFRLLAIGEFRILLLSAFLFPLGFNIPLVYSTVRVQIDPFYARLITPSIGFANFAFRIASGFIALKYREYTTIICGSGMVFGGLAVLVSAFYGHDVVWFQFTYGICYGIAPAFYSTMRAIIYVRSLGLDKLTNAFGLTALAMGVGVFIGTTTGGILNDLTGGYSASFIFAGCCIIGSGSLKLILPLYIKHANARKVKNLQMY